MQHISLLFCGSQFLTYQKNPRGKYVSRRTQPLMWLPEAKRLKTITVFLQESSRMRRTHEPRGAIRYLEEKTRCQPNYRMFRNLRTLQGLGYFRCLRGMDSISFFDYDKWLTSKEKALVRDSTFSLDILTTVRLPKEEVDFNKSRLRNLAPLIRRYDAPEEVWRSLQAVCQQYCRSSRPVQGLASSPGSCDDGWCAGRPTIIDESESDEETSGNESDSESDSDSCSSSSSDSSSGPDTGSDSPDSGSFSHSGDGVQDSEWLRTTLNTPESESESDATPGPESTGHSDAGSGVEPDAGSHSDADDPGPGNATLDVSFDFDNNGIDFNDSEPEDRTARSTSVVIDLTPDDDDEDGSAAASSCESSQTLLGAGRERNGQHEPREGSDRQSDQASDDSAESSLFVHDDQDVVMLDGPPSARSEARSSATPRHRALGRLTTGSVSSWSSGWSAVSGDRPRLEASLFASPTPYQAIVGRTPSMSGSGGQSNCGMSSIANASGDFIDLTDDGDERRGSTRGPPSSTGPAQARKRSHDDAGGQPGHQSPKRPRSSQSRGTAS